MVGAKMTLSEAIDRVNAAFFWDERPPADARTRLLEAILASHAKPGAYVNTFALSPEEMKLGWTIFTGERATSASARHVAAEEACRALRLLGRLDRPGKIALEQSTAALQQCLTRAEQATDHRMGGSAGLFCCGRCTVSVWRHILAGGFDRRPERLQAGVKALKRFRDGAGKWQYFPFWYTVSALAEMDAEIARAEIRFVAKPLERAAAKKAARTEYDRRRTEVARRALAKLI